MNEKEILQKIKNDAEQITPPDTLKPEAIEEMLRRQQADISGSSVSQKPKTAKMKTVRYSRIIRYGSMAAVFALAVTASYQAGRITRSSESPQQSSVVFDEETENTQTAGSTSPDQKPADNNQTADHTSAEHADAKAAYEYEESLTYASDYEYIYTLLYDRFYNDPASESNIALYGAKTSSMSDTAEIAMDTAVRAEGEMGTAAGTGSYSQTNLVEQGVDEADIVKTDGDYLYILRSDGSFAIVKADTSPEVISITQLDLAEDGAVLEMYLDQDMLTVIASEFVTLLENEDDTYETNSTYQTVVYTYDLTDRSAPLLTGTLRQEGNYEDSRKVGDFIYLFTSWYPTIGTTYANSEIAPRINGVQLPASDFYLPEAMEDASYLTISSIDSSSPSEPFDTKVLVSGASTFYVSAENIYIANENRYAPDTRTEITKFHYEDGVIIGAAAGSVPGFLNNSFSMNEYNGMLRLVTTYLGDETSAVRSSLEDKTGLPLTTSEDWTERNALYILDESLQQVSAIKDLAKGETIRSARFLGDTGYFVTFRQTDPLFSVDLSDPEHPQILGELKVSGFSSYLHFYGENQLLGIGYEADESTGSITGLKLSMFDISDPSSVTETHRFVLPGVTWCPAIEDYKSILVDEQKNLIGFYCDNRYLVFSYDPEYGFTQELVYDFYSDLLAGAAEYNTMRGVYIEDTLYLVGNTFIVSFDMTDNFAKKDVLMIEQTENQ